MLKTLTLFLFLALPWRASCHESPVEILFIGNSFIHSYGMHGIVFKLAEAAGIPMDATLHYSEGKSVNYFIHDTACWNRIRSRQWDFIVIQDNQRFYYDSLGKFDSLGYPSPILANNLKFQDSIKKLIPCVQIVYLAGWEQEGGIPARFPGDNTKKMLKRLLANYHYMNNLPGVHNIIAPVGVAWLSAIEHIPYLVKKPFNRNFLYDSDGRHPGWAGSYMAACVVFSTIFHQSTLPLTNSSPFYKIRLDTMLKTCAWAAVLDSFSYSNLMKNTPQVWITNSTVFTTKDYSSYQWFEDKKLITGANTYKYDIRNKESTYWVLAKDKHGCPSRSFPGKMP